jgi:hypothetical protein
LIDLKYDAAKEWAAKVALALMLVALWSVTHRYKGLGGDAELYAVQALSRIYSNLREDLFLRNVSQDTYTIFSPLYAWWIGLLGLRHAALTLAVAFKVWFCAAAWAMARDLFDGHTAFLAVAMLIIATGAYGAYGVFHYAEDWLTARSLGEALVITAVALHFRGLRSAGLLVACGAMFVHPLMALPGILLLLCLWAPLRASAMAAAAAVLTTFAGALYAVQTSATAHFLPIMNAEWLEVVRERSQFLFPQLWSASDWQLNARPFLSLTLSAMVIDEPRVRKLCTSAMLVGASGLAVALIAGSIGPVAALVQGQAWRWVWVTAFASDLLWAPTALRAWQDQKCGALCAILMLSARAIPGIDGASGMACALILWLGRDGMNVRAASMLRWAAIVAAMLTVVWVAEISWVAARSQSFKEIRGMDILSILVVAALGFWIRARRPWIELCATGGALLVLAALTLPGALRDSGREGTAAEIEEFADWRSVIPPDSNVFVVPARTAPTFAWFTLERPSYLTVDQSSGVVFSPETALEVLRRSQTLLPLMDPDWKLLSNMKKARSSGTSASSSAYRPMTRDRLARLCTDPQLNFVVARENVGFDPIRHARPGAWRDWNLYDCRRVRAALPFT